MATAPGPPGVHSFLSGLDNSLANLLAELGYGATADEAAFKALLLKFPEPPSEQAVADVLLLMARTHTGLKESQPGIQAALWMALGLGAPPNDAASLTTWKWPVVMDCLRAAAPRLSWPKVALCLDSERCLLTDQPAFALLAAAYRRGAGTDLPLEALTGGLWKNPAQQLSLLRLAAMAPPDVFNFSASKRVAPSFDGLNAAQLTPNGAWLSVDLLQALAGLYESAGLVQPVRELLQYPATTCPDLLLVTTSDTRTAWNLLMRDVYAVLLPPHLRLLEPAPGTPGPKPYSRELLARIWAASPPEVMLDLLGDLYAGDPMRLPRIVELCSELNILPQVLASVAPAFALELAAAAGGAGLVNLEAWLADYVTRDSKVVIPAMLRFMLTKTADIPAGSVGSADSADAMSAELRARGLPLTAEPARAFLKVLQASAQGLPLELLRELQVVQQQTAKAFPVLAPHISAVSAPDAFASDVEEEANSYFQAIYAPDAMSIDDIIARMQAYKSSHSHRERQVFSCMIHNLFDEYRFFNRYPDRELQITAKVFGSLIKHGLVSSITLGMALNYVKDALCKPVPSRMFTFGLEALRQFAHMISPWPQFCSVLVNNPQLRDADPELYAVVAEQAAAGAAAGATSSAGGTAAAGSAAGVGQGPSSTSAEPAGGGTAGPDGDAASSSAQQQQGGSSRFLTLQPAGGDKSADPPVAAPVPGNDPDRASVAPGPVQPAGAAAVNDVKAAPALGGVAAAGGGQPPQAAAPPQAPQQPENTSLQLSMEDREGDAMSMQLAAQAMAVAQASLAAPVGPSLASLVNTESLESAADKYAKDFKEPPEAVQDKIHFTMNNITKDNLDQKHRDIWDRISPTYLAWFGNYMVVKRAAQEANYHTLYMALLDKFGDKELFRLMVKTTMYYVKVLLYSERILKESNDRALLKNLGVWLGKLTFARNKPVLARDLEIKSIIVEAYQRGRLIAVLPFVQKLLEGCNNSRVFTPTNPMISGILSLLAELHAMKGLKINNAFSIELVFKAFGLNPADVKPTDTLRSLSRERLQNPDWGVDALPQEAPPPTPPAAAVPAPGAAMGDAGKGTSSGPLTPPTPASPAGTQSLQMARGAAIAAAGAQLDAAGKPIPAGPGAEQQAGVSYGMPSPAAAGPVSQPAAGSPSMAAPAIPQDAGLFASLHQHVVINPSLGPIADRLQLKRNVPVAVDRAIGEIITPVVERSVTIACYTTYELVLKDFAQEPDETRLRKAAHLMVSSLAGSLSLVTCKDPLRISLTNQLRQMLQGQVADNAMLEQIVSVVVSDNLDLGCTLIERAATDKAVRDIDKSLQAAYEERAKARAAGKAYVDPSTFHSGGARFPAALPDSLRPRPGSIQPHQLRVYDDFARIPRTAPAPVPAPAATGTVPAAVGPGGAVARPAGFPANGQTPPFQSMDAAPAGGVVGADKAQLVASGLIIGPAGLEPGAAAARPDAAAAALLDRYLLWQQAVDAAVAAKDANPAADQSELQSLLAELQEAVGTSGAPDDAASFFARRILKHLLFDLPPTPPNGPPTALSSPSKLALSFHAACLDWLANVANQQRLAAELTVAYMGSDDERKWNGNVIDMLLRLRLLSLPDLDTYLAKVLAQTRAASSVFTDFLLHLVRVSMLQLNALAFSDLGSTMDLLARLAGNNVGLLQLLEQARKAAVGPVISRPPGEIPACCLRDKFPDPAGLRDQSLQLFEEWVRLCNAHADEKTLAAFLAGQVRAAGVLKLDDTTDRFLRTCTELSVQHCLASADAAAAAAAGAGAARPEPAAGPLSFMATDALVALVVALVVQGGGEALLTRYLGVLVGVIKRDADLEPLKFNARPYLRIWVGLMSELGRVGVPEDTPPAQAVGAGDTTAQLSYLRACGLALYQLQPLSVPGFAFAWLELVAHRAFMPRILTAPLATGWGLFASLLVALLRFMEQYLRGADLADSIKQLYKGGLRLLLVLLHDFPEFLCEHHFSLCDAIPPPAIQMRNLVLSAFPRNMRLPDPFTPNLKVDLLPEIQALPRIVPDPEQLLPEALRAQVDSFLRARSPPNLPAELAKRCVMGPGEAAKAGVSMAGGGPLYYNVPLINALVLYVGSQAKTVSSPLHPCAQDLYVRMASELDAEGRYLLLNAMANQLRYPNAHTYYFSCTLLTLFMESKSEALKEQITRTLLERLIVNRPHPWGLLITFIELIKNRRYNFWSHSFTKCAPEIENLFASVSRSCLGTARPDEDVTGQHPKEGVVRG